VVTLGLFSKESEDNGTSEDALVAGEIDVGDLVELSVTVAVSRKLVEFASCGVSNVAVALAGFANVGAENGACGVATVSQVTEGVDGELVFAVADT
jgi:hypothetical protein